MAEEVSSIGVKLSLNAGSFMTGMTAATEKTESFVAAAKEAQTVAGKSPGSGQGPGSSAAQKAVKIPVDLSVSAAQITSIRKQIIAGIGTINVPINAQLTKAAQSEAKAVMAAVSTPSVGTRAGARTAVESTVAQNLPKRQYGGSVQANRGVLVGERRPEVFVPRQSGSIHPDASRYYREQEQAARRAATAERQHQERMSRIRGGGVRGYGGKYGSARPGSSRVASAEPGWAHHVTGELNPIRSSSIPGVRPLSPGFGGEPSSSWWGGGIQPRYGPRVVRTRPTQDFLNEGTYFDSAGSPSPIWRTEGLVPRRDLQYYGSDDAWHKFRRGRSRHGGGYVHAMAGAVVGVEERLTRLQRAYTPNIRAAARRLTPDVTRAGIEWYPNAQEWIGQQAIAFDKPEPMVRGMAAALSAGTSWPANKTKLLRILQADAAGKPFPYSRALDAHVKAEKMLAGADPWSLLGHTPKTGQFFLNTGGDLDALTIDRWAYRTATRGAISQYGKGPVRTGSDRAFRKVAKEMGIHPVQLQAALWIQEKYDADVAAGKTPNIAKYMRGGGMVHAAKGFFMKGDQPVGDMGSGFVRNLTRRYTPKGGTERLVYAGIPHKKMTPEEAIAAIEAHNLATEAGPSKPAVTYMHGKPPPEMARPSAEAIAAKKAEVAEVLKAQAKAERDRVAHPPAPAIVPTGDLEADAAKAIEETYGYVYGGYHGGVEGREKANEEFMGGITKQVLTSGKQPQWLMAAPRVSRMPGLTEVEWRDGIPYAHGYRPHGIEEGERLDEYTLDWDPAGGGGRTRKRKLLPVTKTALELEAAQRQKTHKEASGGYWDPATKKAFARATSWLEGGVEGAPTTKAPSAAYVKATREATRGAQFGPNPQLKVAPGWTVSLDGKETTASDPGSYEPTSHIYVHSVDEAAGTAVVRLGSGVGKEGHLETVDIGRLKGIEYQGITDPAHALASEARNEATRKLNQITDIAMGTGKSGRLAKDTPEYKAAAAAAKLAAQAEQEARPPHPGPIPMDQVKDMLAQGLNPTSLKDRIAAVPQHEAPEVIAHQAVMEAHEVKKAPEAAAQVAVAAAPASPPTPPDDLSLRGLGLYSVSSRRTRQPTIEEKLGIKVPWSRAAGGDVGNGLYVVNEMGPEAFIEGRDVSKLRARRPDIYGRIPGAHDGMRTGMIDRPAWSMFAPQKDGLIVRREDAHAALGAVHAKDGIITPEHFGDEAEERRKFERAWSGYSAPKSLYMPQGAESPGPIATAARRTRDEGMEAWVAGIKADAAEIRAHAEATKKGTTLIASGTEQIAGLLTAGPTAIPLGGPTTRPTGLGPIALGAGAGAPAARPPVSHPAGHAYWKTPEGLAELAMIEGKTTAGPAVSARPGKPTSEYERKRALGSSAEADAARAAFAAHRGGVGFESAAGLSTEEQSAVNVGMLAVQARREAEGGASDQETRIEEMRQSVAGVAAYESARNPKGIAAVLGQLGLGGGRKFRERQAELTSASGAYRKRARAFENAELQYEGRKEAVEQVRAAGETPSDKLMKQLADREGRLTSTRKNLADATERLTKAEKDVQPTASNVIKSFGAVIVSTSLYGAAMSAVSFAIDKAAIPAMGRWIDQMTGWQSTATKVTTALGDQLYASHGNIAAVMAQTAANAGLSKSMMDYVGNAVEASAFAKAGAKAQGEASDLFRTAIRGGPPEGLYGGYGGILGTSLLGSEMGGGKGLTETISQDLKLLAGGRGKGGANFPIIGNPADAQQNLGGGVDFILDRDFRDYITGKGKQQGGFSGAVSTLAELPGGAGNILGGLGDVASMINPFGSQNFLRPGVNAQGVPYTGGGQPGRAGPGGRAGAFGRFGAMPAAGAQGYEPAAAPPAPEKPFVAPIMAGPTGQALAPGSNEAIGVTNYLEDLNKAMERGAKASDHAATGHYRVAKSAEEMTKAEGAAIQANDKNGIANARLGVILADNTDTVIDNGKAYQAVNEDIARGKTTVDEAVRAGLVTRQLQAGQQANAIGTQRAINVDLPFEMSKQLLSSPLLKPGGGFFPGAGRGAPSATGAGLTGRAAGFAQQALRGTAADNTQLQAIAQEGIDQQRASIAQFTPENLPDFNAAVKEAQGLSAAIAQMSNRMNALNRAASQASWANQIRLATRALGDALAMEGKAGGTRLGQLEREQHFIERAQTALSLALQQRQITTQVALAGFQAPGETGEERYARQKEQLAEAAIKQKQLDLSKQDFAVAGQSWVENVKRSAVDAAKAIEVMQKARDAEGYAIAAQESIAKKEQLLAHTVGKLDNWVAQARGNFQGALQAAAGGVAEFGGAVDVAVREIYKTLGYKQDSKGNYYKPSEDTATGRGPRRPSMGYMGRHAAGYAGAATGGGAMFTVGEAGPETVAILRNPRTHMLQGEGGGGGGGSAPITINVNGPIVREEKDIRELARCVAEEVERTLSRKGQLLGLRSPAY